MKRLAFLLPILALLASSARADAYSADFTYGEKTYTVAGVSGTNDVPVAAILASLEIPGAVTALEVAPNRGMSAVESNGVWFVQLTKAFGTSWIRPTVDGAPTQISVTCLPDGMGVALYGWLRFDPNGGTGTMVSVSTRQGRETTLPACTFAPPDGQEFVGWELGGETYQAGDLYYFEQSVTAKALWADRAGVHAVTLSFDATKGRVVATPTRAVAGDLVTLAVMPGNGFAAQSVSVADAGGGNPVAVTGADFVYRFEMPDGDAVATVAFVAGVRPAVPYLVAGETLSCSDYRFASSGDATWSAGWYFVPVSMRLGARVAASGDVHLILGDGATLSALQGVSVCAGSSLTIYAQSEGDAMGALVAERSPSGYYAGIGSGGTDSLVTSVGAGAIRIHGGRITAYAGPRAAAIGGGYDSSHEGIHISGGVVKAIGYSGDGGAGIGGGFAGEGGNIVIDGNADVTATGGAWSAGIGGGNFNGAGTVSIAGSAVVNATGGENGSGIGCGRSGTGGTVEIGGNAVVTATGGAIAAGIGGGYGSSSGGAAVVIKDSATVTATGSSSSAGIGGGSEGGGGNVQIKDSATVTAIGGSNAAAIGSGSAGGFGTIRISGGTVTAAVAANSGAAAIGAGSRGKGGTVIIEGGSVTATGDGIYGIGIGAGNTGATNNLVSVAISGGTVTASARVGIGSGNAAQTDVAVEITGGDVTATGTANGAGIGTGNNAKSFATVSISGGKVTAGGAGTGIGLGGGTQGGTAAIALGATDDGTEITATTYRGSVTLANDLANKASLAQIFPAGAVADNAVLSGVTLVRSGYIPPVGYAAWAVENGVSGAWDATDARGIHNVFRYAFDDTNAVPDPAFLSISFDASGAPVVVTPAPVSAPDFTFELLAYDTLTNAVPSAVWPLSSTGTNAVPGAVLPARFFRLRATER